MVRLGAGGLDGRALTPEAMHAALQVLSKFRRLAESHRVDEIVAVATSAVREAENGGEFLRTIAQQTGIRAARHFRHRRSAADSPGGGLRRQRPAARSPSSSTSAAAASRSRAGAGAERRSRPQLQARRDPADRTVREERSARRPRRAQARQAHRRRSWASTSTSSRAPASIASSARLARF